MIAESKCDLLASLSQTEDKPIMCRKDFFLKKGMCSKENSQQLAYSVAPESDDLRLWNIRVDEW